MPKQPTVIDVAKLADVGTSTVSRYLRGIQVGAESEKRISSAGGELEHMPDKQQEHFAAIEVAAR
jgi:DNA-binding LacI/PurR family transcriptional regulator